MTAIAGFFRLPGETPPDSRCKQAIDRLRAYGSHVCGDSCADNFAVAISPFPAPQKLPFEQPFEHDSRWIAAIDARLDNRDSLIRELELGQTNALSDESLIFSAWIRWGTHSLGRLVGDFALVVFDRSSRCLTLARDASGQRPIYYALRDGGVAFASMPSGVCSLLPGAEPNFQKLAADLVEYLDHGSDTVFSGIKRVRPGEMVTIRDGVAECLMHWNPAIEPRSQGSDAAYVDEYRDILDRSTAARMKAASRPLGILLSAGYDSNAVAATAARLIRKPDDIIAFTSAPIALETQLGRLPRGRFADESGLAASSAARYGIRHCIIRDASPIFDAVQRQEQLCQLPIISPFNMSWWTAIRRAARDLGVTVMLTAEQGNHSLNAGGLATLAEFIRRGQWLSWWREASANLRRTDVRWRGILFNSFGGFLPAWANDALRRTVHHVSAGVETTFLRSEWIESLAGADFEYFRPSSNTSLDRLRVIRATDAGPYRKAAIADCGMLEGDPMSDRRALEFALALPPEQMLRAGVSRPLARAALADRVPAEILNSPLRGVQSADWHLRLTPQAARDVLEDISASNSAAELLDLESLDRAITDWPESGSFHGQDRWKYFIGLPAALATGTFIKNFRSLS